jgi:hypothetical protein
MAQIQPISTWFQGAEHQANVFNLYCSGDNLIDSATFKYQLIELIVIPESESLIDDEDGTSHTVINPEQQTSQTLVTGELSINGTEYADWDLSISANEWIYQWAVDKLGLIIENI